MKKLSCELPEALKSSEFRAFTKSASQFVEPTKRRARRHFDEELCFFTDRFQGWLNCKGSNHDFIGLPKEDRQVVNVLLGGLMWLRLTYCNHLISKPSTGNRRYIPWDYRKKTNAVKDFIVERFNAGEMALSEKQARGFQVKRADVSRDFDADDSGLA